ncbi:hypothetical protein WME76_09740 [Sorangium sp. So ce119]|uniref:hypothetical protein n=1 Tax=Sorangium sp. So ce119 TaxID=3133279 RepID=UPI003F60F1BF
MEPSIIPDLLSFRAPWLEEKLVKERMVASREEAALLFDEVKKYLFLVEADAEAQIPMFSRRLDEIWHQLILFTEEYESFGRRFFGELVHHAANTAPRAQLDRRPALRFEQFRARYEPLFGPISDAWRDELAVTPDTRVIRVKFGRPIFVRVEQDHAELVWSLEPPRVLLRVDAWARDALQFLVDCDHFYVRELPGLGDAERVALCRPLVKGEILRIAP